MTWLRAATGAVVAVTLLSGCTPTPTVLPEAIAEHTGSTEFESNEFVVAIRAQELARALAWNSADFTISALTETSSAEDIAAMYDYFAARARQGFSPLAFAGPPIWAPVSVTVTGDTAEVVACMATQDREITHSDPATSYDLAMGTLRTWTYTLTDAGILSQDPKTVTGGECDASAAEVLTFDPVPTPAEKITEGDIRKPAAG